MAVRSFARSADGSTADRLPAFWADGAACSVGCRPVGAKGGWPLRPFHQQHPLRAGLNERRPVNMHRGVDIQAQDGTPVYAMQPGIAHVMASGTVDERVQVGSYVYWHLYHRVRTGQSVRAYDTVVGTIINGAGHLHLSEVSGGRYLNPLRPGGRVLAPWTDTEPPVIGRPVVHPNGRVTVEVFDPQSFRAQIKYRTPVLAPAAVAYRAWDADGHEVMALQFALRGSQHLPDSARWVVYADDAYPPGRDTLRRAPGLHPALGLSPGRRPGATVAAHRSTAQHLRLGLGGERRCPGGATRMSRRNTSPAAGSGVFRPAAPGPWPM